MLCYSYKIILIIRHLIKLKSLNYLKKAFLLSLLKLKFLIRYVSLTLNSLIKLSTRALKTSLRSQD
jgi:hypothetical protein